MLQRLFTVSALLVSAVAVSYASEIHVRFHQHHQGSNAKVKASNAGQSSTSGSAATAGSVTAGSTGGGAWAFTPVRSIQARVQGDAPGWDKDNSKFVGSFGKTYDEKYRSVLDTVNTASVEGALMYVQAEGINVNEQSVKCERKNKMQYIVFYDISVVQPTNATVYYDGKNTPEYGPFVAMDGGACTPAGDTIPETCSQYDGLNNTVPLGHYVGAGEQVSDPRAPYPGNYWFSYPNSCVTKAWAAKTDECRKQYPGGLCPAGTKPDGVKCSYSYEILGYLNIDDLVGITDGSAAENKYKNYTEFCLAGNVEFAAENTGTGFKVDKSIDFWKDPGDQKANQERTDEMIKMYNKLAPKAKIGEMTELPEIKDLVKANPPCYKNSKTCATSSYGCRRILYSQICQVCESSDKDTSDCVKAPSGFKFPDLPMPKAPTLKSESGQNNGGTQVNPMTNAASTVGASATLVLTAAAAVLL